MENREAAWEERQSDRVEGLLGKVQKRIARVSGKAGNENAVSFLESGRDGEGNADRDTFFFGSGPSNIENSSAQRSQLPRNRSNFEGSVLVCIRIRIG